MSIVSHPLSSSASPKLISSLKNTEFNQFQRTYPGSYKINFAKCLSATNDFKVHNYSNFYLTNNFKISDILKQPVSEIKSKFIFGELSLGGSFLSFSEINPMPYASIGQSYKRYDYGVPVFVSQRSDTTNITIEIFNSNKCHIYYTKNYKKYYLCSDIDNKLIFCKESLLSFSDSTINPQDFIYLYVNDDQSMVFFKYTNTGTYTVRKNGNSLELAEIIEDDSYTYLSNSFDIARPLYSPFNSVIDTSFINYTESNDIDNSKSSFNLSNNLLLHKKYSYAQATDIVVLKNQLSQNDTFTTGNNLLSGSTISTFSDKHREYSSIASDIKQENTEDLELNYVFYNKSYKIVPGSNVFVSPSSLYPFESLNINDSKLVASGAFSYITPEYADKIYHLSNDPKNYDNGQFLLYTWLSGSQGSSNSEKVWVDRYYYPDLISKEAALSGRSIVSKTYDDMLEQLIRNNSTLSNDVDIVKFFDKKSDLTFYPNQKYQYDRLTPSDVPQLVSTFTYCKNFTSSYPDNYFKQINTAGQMSLGFNFIGDNSSWTVASDRNDINSGISITKTGSNIEMVYRIYDATEDFFDESSNSWTEHRISLPIKILKSNYVLFSIDSKSGNGYFFLNNVIVYSFKLESYQFTTKQLIYGDLFMYIDSIKTNLLSPTITQLDNVFISDYYIEKDLAFTIPLLNGSIKIDDLTITLPCGMRNSSDIVESLQSVCGAAAFKSNNVNLYIKNLNIENESVLKGIKDSITSNVPSILPANNQINTIEFKNYK